MLLAIVFGIVNAYLRPIVKALSLPLNLLTFGLVGLIINVALVMVAAAISDTWASDCGSAAGRPRSCSNTLVAAFLISLLISIVAAIVALVRKLTPGI